MIGSYVLKKLLSRYGIDLEKIAYDNESSVISDKLIYDDNKNEQLDYEEYKRIDNTLDYLVNTLKINVHDIEQYPYIMNKNVNLIKLNVEFLKKQNIAFPNVQVCLKILSKEPKMLKGTYNYIINNYGLSTLNNLIPILGVNKKRIVSIEKLEIDKNNKLLNLYVAISEFNLGDIKCIVRFCKENNIQITKNLFSKTKLEVQQIISICEENDIELTDIIFNKSSNDIEEILRICNKNNIKIIGSVFTKSPIELQKIIELCNENSIEIKYGMFQENSKELEDIINLFKKYNIKIENVIFKKKLTDLKNSIDYLNNEYGSEYLKPFIIIRDVKYLKEVFTYLDGLGIIKAVLESPCILSLTLEEIKIRKSKLDEFGIPMVDGNNKFNSIFGLSKKSYNEYIESKN